MYLYENLGSILSKFNGSVDRVQMFHFLKVSEKNILTNNYMMHLMSLLKSNVFSIESNLDRIIYPGRPSWFEYDHIRDETVNDLFSVQKTSNTLVKRGVLLAKIDDDNYTVFSGWSFVDNTAHHSYSIMRLNRYQIIWLATMARKMFDPDETLSKARIFDLAKIYIPQNFKEELEYLDHTSKQNIQITSKMDVLSELLFMFAILLINSTEQVNISSIDHDNFNDDRTINIIDVSPLKGKETKLVFKNPFFGKNKLIFKSSL